MPGEGVSVQPITSGIAEEIFQHEILFEGLRRLGYEGRGSARSRSMP